MTEFASLLQRMRTRERELHQRIADATARAAADIEAAQKQSAQTVQRAEQEAQSAADELVEREIQTSQQEADALVIAAEEEAAALRHGANERLDEMVTYIVAQVLPAQPSTDPSTR